MNRISRIAAVMLVVALTAQTGVAAAGYNFVDGISEADTSTMWIWGSNAVDGTFISRSTDGGVTWQASAWEPQLAVNAVDARADGDSAVAVLAGADNVITTTDGGSTWTTSAPMLDSAQVNFNDIEWLPGTPGTRVAVGQKRDTPNGAVALFARAPGAAWATAFEGPWYSPATEFDPIPQTWAEGWAVDAAPGGTTLYAAANEYDFVQGDYPAFMRPLIYKSTNGGSTWTTAVASAVTSGYPLTSISAASGNVAFAGDDAARHVLRTLDGVNWTQVQLPQTSPTPSSLALDALDANRLLVGGYNGRLGWTSNASSPTPSFTYFTVPGSPRINGVSMLSATNWIAVGANETIYRTTNAGASWSGSTLAAAPGVTMTAPAANFSLNAGAVTIQGTSADAGVGVSKVEVRVRRADGQTWNGIGWSAADTWLPAQRVGGSWNSWTYSWAPDAALVASGQIVNVAARATDGMALSKSTLGVNSASGSLATPSLSLAGGATYTKSSTVDAAISAAGYPWMRYRVGAGTPTAWIAAASSSIVTLGAGDGLKTVTYEFSSNQSSVDASASDTITLDATVPTAVITSPAQMFSLVQSQIAVAGTAADAASGISATELRIERKGLYWDGSAWSATEAWLPVSGTTAWNYDWLPDADTMTGSHAATLTARATDVAGNTGLSTSVVSTSIPVPTLALKAPAGPVAYGSSISISGTMSVGAAPVAGRTVTIQAIDAASGAVTTLGSVTTGASGTFSRSAVVTKNTAYRAVFAGDAEYGASTSALANVKAYASLPVPTAAVAWARPRVNAPLVRRVTVTGSLLPAHAAGSAAVTLHFERYVIRDGVGRWVPVSIKQVKLAANGTSYTGTQWLTAKGTWRVRAKHGDASHALTTSGTRTFYAR